MGDSYVVKGAKLKCSCGDRECSLQPNDHGAKIKGKDQANITDCVPMVNVPPFGMCSSLANPTVAAATAANYGRLQKMPCIPLILAPWIDGKMNCILKGAPALVKSSTLICAYAGQITIQDDGAGGLEQVGAKGVRIRGEKESERESFKQEGNPRTDERDVRDKSIEIVKTKIGVTGEGIPINQVNPKVLEEIHFDNNAAYGYLPNKGTTYDNPTFDFTDVNWAKKQREIRKDYLDGSKQLEVDIIKMQNEGLSKRQIAKHVVEARNQQKIKARVNNTAEEVAALEARNIKKYGNPIGPTPESIFEQTKNSLVDKGIYESDEKVWDVIIEKSMKKDDVINTLLGLRH